MAGVETKRIPHAGVIDGSFLLLSINQLLTRQIQEKVLFKERTFSGLVPKKLNTS